MSVGSKIKTLRETQQLTQAELAQNAGMTETDIVRMESTDIIPSLAPLIKVARALGVRLGTFLDDNTNLGPVINRKEEHNKVKNFSSRASQTNSSLNFYALAGKKAGRHMEPFLIDLEPQKEQNPVLSTHEGEEFIYVLKGSIQIIYGKQSYVLEVGDSIYYDAIVDHFVSAATDQPATIVAVVYTPM